MKIKILLLFCLMAMTNLTAQNLIVKGTVTDAKTGEILVYANVVEVGTNNGVVTDIDGKFTLKITDSNSKFLKITFVGYELSKVILDFKQEVQEVEIYMFPGVQAQIPEIPGRRIYAQPHSENGKLLNRSTPTTILTASAFERNDGFTLAPVLNQTPGVYMHNGTLNTNRITIRGIGARTPFSTSRVRTYINEIPLNSGDGESGIEDFDLSLFDKVEINKGPGDVLHGSSLGGTILLKTLDRFKNPNQFKSQVQFGRFNTISTTNQLTANLSRGWLNIRHALLSSDGYRDNNELTRQNFTLTGKIDASKIGNFFLLANYTNAKAEIPSSLDSTTFVNKPSAAAQNWEGVNGNEDYDKGTFGLSYQKDFFDAGWQIAGSVFYNFRNNDEVRPFNILNENSDNFGVRAKTTYNTNINEQPFELIIGTEIFNENYDWQTFENSDNSVISNINENRFYYNIFAQADYKIIDGLIFNTGLNFNQTRYEINDFITTSNQSTKSFTPTVSPRFGLVLEPSLPKRIGEATVYLNVAHGISPATSGEIGNLFQNSNIEFLPEQGWNYEIGTRGYLWKYPSTFQNYAIYYDLSVYRMNVENLLIGSFDALGQFVLLNSGETQHDGLEALVKITPYIDKKYHFDFSVAYTLNNYKFSNFNAIGIVDYTGNQLTGVPQNTVQTFVDFHYDFKENIQLYTNINYQFVDEMPINDGNTVYSENYQLTNAKIGLRYSFEKVFLNFYGGMNNIFDEKYASMLAINSTAFGANQPRYYYPGLPRNFYGGMSVQWKF
jgi:iron complex outermembrane receptor protein